MRWVRTGRAKRCASKMLVIFHFFNLSGGYKSMFTLDSHSWFYTFLYVYYMETKWSFFMLMWFRTREVAVRMDSRRWNFFTCKCCIWCNKGYKINIEARHYFKTQIAYISHSYVERSFTFWISECLYCRSDKSQFEIYDIYSYSTS